MFKPAFYTVILFLFIFQGCGCLFPPQDPSPVVFTKTQSGWDLTVHGTPTRIKGVGFDYTLGGDSPSATSTDWFSYIHPDIAGAGANCIRTYGIEWTWANPEKQAALISGMLKYAAESSTTNHFITVLPGLVYNPSEGDMAALMTQTLTIVSKDPNFDHLLGWCIGNEIAVDDYEGLNSTIAAFKAAMTPAKIARPVMTAVATVSSGQVAIIKSKLPAIDWLGINTFYGAYDSSHAFTGFLSTQADNLGTGGWDKPWAITEYYSYDLPAAPFPGFAGMPFQTLNGEPYYLELNSTLNAQNYTDSYTQYITSANALAKGSVGGFVLNWGPPHNSKLTAFWKETYVYRGEFKPFVNPPYSIDGFDRLEAADAVAKMYGGSLSSKPCPQIVLPDDGDRQGIACTFKATLTHNPTPTARGTSLTARIKATDSGTVTFDWYLIGGTSAGYTGDINGANKKPQDYISTTSLYLGSGTTTTAGGTHENTITFTAPAAAASGNNYQLRVIIRDAQGGAATAAIGFAME